MGVLAWLGVPAVATLLAIVWVNWAARPRGPVETEESLAERERFKAAFSRLSGDGGAREDVTRAPVAAEPAARRAS
ncbi:MAG TPA: hypothetical protein VHV76_00775 [Mycobacteriales bacterium]|nr:hypothetical protein [Mycobacteriales bacterium]